MNQKKFDGPQSIVEAYLQFQVKTETDNFVKAKLLEKNNKTSLSTEESRGNTREGNESSL